MDIIVVPSFNFSSPVGVFVHLFGLSRLRKFLFCNMIEDFE
ncbi:MAG: hypothetical protein AVDCRST_MAG96-744 [uncultured Segetibacter sp.]|uniref:Uncharacterized protein n=1 Tax=uncultured Segetibacter sp. TaxID=481133 RepID=A0A6J4RMI3_9BACT|nr:MAG: hypothetical protein AVDCRST_MAG96-744 [uncultured Segetibacter sp.]